MLNRMTNPTMKSKKGGSLCKNTAIIAADNNIGGATENYVCVDEVGGVARWENVGSRFNGNDSIETTTTGEDDDDQVPNSDDTSTSFSLQECMDEFRARRIRKSSLTQNRQEVEKNKSRNNAVIDATERDIINQNLCNKEQERKCKPCQNGFCYCFTSDSGDGGHSLAGCLASEGTNMRNYRRYRRIGYDQNSHEMQNSTNLQKLNELNKNLPQTQKSSEQVKSKSNGNRKRNHIVAISRLETSTKDEPLVHIIQELHNNCVISEVRVNKDKMNSSMLHGNAYRRAQSSSFKFKRGSTDNSKHLSCYNNENPNPSAPTLEDILERKKPQMNENYSTQILDKSINRIQCKVHRHNAGGLLLKKRAPQLVFDYKLRNTKNPPPKPPRNSLSSDDKYTRSTESTSSSVKEAEKIVDEFLEKKGIVTISSLSKRDIVAGDKSNGCSKYQNDKRKSYPLSSKDKIKPVQNFLRTHTSLGDVERVAVSKKDLNHGKNIRPLVESKAKVPGIDWNESKINHMLHYEKNAKSKTFHSTAIQAQPQHPKSREELAFENSIGWKIPLKVNLDAVDGIEHHNLASNIIDKSTPIKKKFISKLKSSRTQNFLWSEQLRQLSWPNKKKNKDNTFSSPKDFIKLSKTKLLRFVTPKKENKDSNNVEIRKTPFRNIGVQTSCDDISHCHFTNNSSNQNSSFRQSPPGSYHSPVQSSHIQSVSSAQSQYTTSNVQDCTPKQFDFSRIVHSPPKKTSRSSQRKLNFTHKEVEFKSDDFRSIEAANEKKTYRSFNKDFNQDASISEIGNILNNIRTKLEESDKQAVRTFLQTEFDVERSEIGFDCPDSHRTMQNSLQVESLPPRKMQRPVKNIHLTDPIYSEIEENSIHIIESPNFDNHTGVQHFKNVNYPDLLYAKVNKYPKPVGKPAECHLTKQPQLPLAKIIHDSLKNKNKITNITPLTPLPEPSGSETASYSSPTSFTKPLTHCQSLNNVKVLENNMIPNQQIYISKSDLSLHRSEIFLENLCSSELNVERGFLKNNLEKVQNSCTIPPYISMSDPTRNDDSSRIFEGVKELQPTDSVSYEMPNNEDDLSDGIVSGTYEKSSIDVDSNLGLNTIEPPSCNNQSTPKKQSFVTKDDSSVNELHVNVQSMKNNGNIYNSCSNASRDLCGHSCSINEEFEFERLKRFYETSNVLSSRYKIFKNALRRSFKKGKEMIKNKKKRLSTSLNLSSSNPLMQPTICGSTSSDLNSNLNLNELFSLNESASLCDQIVHTVSICRQLPDVKRSSEMVEAERLLLFSTLRRRNQDALITKSTSLPLLNQCLKLPQKFQFFVDDMILPIHAGVNKDIYFNYFYTVTFQYGSVIKSTQSAECENGAAIFRDCGLEFISGSAENKSICQDAIRCQVFMLRLRKISTLPIEPKKRTITKTLIKTSSSIRSASTSSSLSSASEIVSRFRLQGSFIVDAASFKPYEYVPQESYNSDEICLRASSFYNIPITSQRKSTNLVQAIQLKGRADLRFSKCIFRGYLNVQDLKLKHNWNRRWCILNGIYFYVWHDENTFNTNPLIVFDLRDTNQCLSYPLTNASRELCARQRSFCLERAIQKECETSSRTTVFFSADSQKDLDDWLNNINNVLHFITTWLC